MVDKPDETWDKRPNRKPRLVFGRDQVCHFCKSRGTTPYKPDIPCRGCEGRGFIRKEQQ